MKWTPEDRTRHNAIRERFQKERPSLQQLVDSGEWTPPLPHYIYLELRLIVRQLKAAREVAGLSLAEVAQRIRLSPDGLADLERGVFDHPTVETLMRYVAALGKKLVWSLQDLTPAKADSGG